MGCHCCRCEAICGIESPDQEFVSGANRGGVVGAMARSNFLMSRKKVLKVTMLKDFDDNDNSDVFGTMKNKKTFDPRAKWKKAGNMVVNKAERIKQAVKRERVREELMEKYGQRWKNKVGVGDKATTKKKKSKATGKSEKSNKSKKKKSKKNT